MNNNSSLVKISKNIIDKIMLSLAWLILFKNVVLYLIILGLFIKLIPIPTIKNFLPFLKIVSCRIPQTFFLSIRISFGFFIVMEDLILFDIIRGLLPSSTLTNMFIFGNGRFFESLISKLRVQSLSELNYSIILFMLLN